MANVPSTAKRPKAYERHAWILLLLSTAPQLIGSLAHLLSGRPLAAGLQFASTDLGMTWEELVSDDPAVANVITGFVRMMAAFMMGFFILYVSMVVTSYRRGEQWAWFVGWIYPGAIVGFASIATLHGGWSEGELATAGPGIAIVMLFILLGLLLPFRRFFPKMDDS